MNRNLKVRGGAAAVLAVVFAAGTALGLALGSGWEPAHVDASVESRLSVGRSAAPNEWIVDRLDLTAAQRAAIDSVVQHFGGRMGSFQKEYRPRYRAIVDSASEALRGLLDEEQRSRYDSLEAAVKRRLAGEGLAHDLP